MTDEVKLDPCPFCRKPLSVRHPNLNPLGRCETEGCWMEQRRISVPLDDPAQLAQWNTRPTPSPASSPIKEDEVERVAKAVMVAQGCGLTIEGEHVFCDDPRAFAKRSCECREIARAAIDALSTPRAKPAPASLEEVR
ncbi:MAG TPA: hypothetical protein VGW34_03275 [Allosphingosinicella sp.]|nr:hypothetical protein [Allosphingosinicella sp.]